MDIEVKKNAQAWTIKEQVIVDDLIGLVFRFEVMPDGRQCLSVSSAGPHPYLRELFFNKNGEFDGSQIDGH